MTDIMAFQEFNYMLNLIVNIIFITAIESSADARGNANLSLLTLQEEKDMETRRLSRSFPKDLSPSFFHRAVQQQYTLFPNICTVQDNQEL